MSFNRRCFFRLKRVTHYYQRHYHTYIDDTIFKKNTDHNTTLLYHYSSVHIDAALTIYADGKV